MPQRLLIVLTVLLVPSLPGQLCVGENTSAAFQNAAAMGGPNLRLAIRWTSTASLFVDRIEVFTGESTAPSRLGLWSDAPGLNRPLAPLGAANWNMNPTNQWQGADMGALIPVALGQAYWIVWNAPAGCQSSSQSTPPLTIQPQTATSTAGGPWTPGVPVTAWKWRFVCTPPGGGTAGYQANQLCANLTINGLQSPGSVPAILAVGPGVPVTFSWNGLSGFPYGIAALANGALLPNWFITPASQIINIPAFPPTWFIQPGPPLVPGTLTIPLPPGFTSIEAQMAVANPAHPDGVCLSQAVQLR